MDDSRPAPGFYPDINITDARFSGFASHVFGGQLGSKGVPFLAPLSPRSQNWPSKSCFPAGQLW
jgi:hypothetical protein